LFALEVSMRSKIIAGWAVVLAELVLSGRLFQGFGTS